MKTYTRIIGLLLALSAIACSGKSSPLSPTASAPVTIICSGQSNASALCGGIDPATGVVGWMPQLSAYGRVVGEWLGGQSITAWNDVPGSLWNLGPTRDGGLLAAMLANPQASGFVWWQGEADYGNPDGWYLAKLQALIARVRATMNQPRLRVAVVALGPAYQDFHIVTEQQQFVSDDANAVYIPTADLPYKDGIHMTLDSYATVAGRIAQALR